MTLPDNRIHLDLPHDIPAFSRRCHQEKSLEMSEKDLVDWFPDLVWRQQLQICQHGCRLFLIELLRSRYGQQNIRQEVRFELRDQHRMRGYLKRHVLQRCRDATSSDVALVLGEDGQFGDGHHAVVLLPRDKVVPTLRVLGDVREEVGEVVEVGMLVCLSLCAFDEAVHQLVDRVRRFGHGLWDRAFECDNSFERVGFGQVGQEHGDFVC